MIKVKAIKEVSFLWMGSLMGALAAFLIQVLIARKLGVEEYGLFSSVIAIIALLVPLVGFGVSQFWLKAYGFDGWKAQRWLKVSFRFLVLSTLIVISIYTLFVYVVNSDFSIKQVFLWMILFLLGQVVIELVSVRLQLEERFMTLASWQLFPHLIRLIMVLFAFNFYTVMSAYHVTLIFSLVSLLFIVIGTVYLWNMYVGKWQLKGHIEKENSGITPPSPRPIELIKSIWPFGLATFFYIIYYQSDIVFLKYMVRS